jgi:translation initiation factor IF-1
MVVHQEFEFELANGEARCAHNCRQRPIVQVMSGDVIVDAAVAVTSTEVIVRFTGTHSPLRVIVIGDQA